MEKLIGRHRECEELRRAMASPRSEFVILYGRRRIGKTFLVRHYFDENFDFRYVGVHRMKGSIQLQNFRQALISFSGDNSIPDLTNWLEAFKQLEKYLESMKSARKKVLFFDEMPWIDTKHSDFVAALEYFWNSWGAYRDDIVLVACGSATSWMADKLMENQGGLHNRITRRIYLAPFTLAECNEYLGSRDFDWDMHQLIRCYMILGGVPYYWSLLEQQDSLAQNIDRLCFNREGLLHNEFDELYSALFTNAEYYMSVVRELAAHSSGMTRDEIIKATGHAGGSLSKLLANLERCAFISSYSQFGTRSSKLIYRLTDFYTLFYLRFIQNEHTYDQHYWSHHSQSREVTAWKGLTFELVCLMHLSQIKKALGISGMETSVSAWRYIPSNPVKDGLPEHGAQIDLLISRADKIIHICEIKFSEDPYAITKEYEQHLRERMSIFRQVTKTRSALVHTFIATEGLAPGKHTSLVHSQITGRDLIEHA
ncbi:MAG: ATP-binding protein [Victivallales bacterium]|nr:ATP-binding protein [Victivallales bacterium]